MHFVSECYVVVFLKGVDMSVYQDMVKAHYHEFRRKQGSKQLDQVKKANYI